MEVQAPPREHVRILPENAPASRAGIYTVFPADATCMMNSFGYACSCREFPHLMHQVCILAARSPSRVYHQAASGIGSDEKSDTTRMHHQGSRVCSKDMIEQTLQQHRILCERYSTGYLGTPHPSSGASTMLLHAPTCAPESDDFLDCRARGKHCIGVPSLRRCEAKRTLAR